MSVLDGQTSELNHQTYIYGKNGPEKTENSFDKNKLVVRERKTWPSLKVVANVYESGVGERLEKMPTTEVDSMDKFGVGERMQRLPITEVASMENHKQMEVADKNMFGGRRWPTWRCLR